MNTDLMTHTLHLTGEAIALEHEFRRLGRSIVLATRHILLQASGEVR